MTDTTFELPFVKLLDAQGDDVYFIVTEIAAIVPLGTTPNPFARVEPVPATNSDIGGIDAKIAQAASGVDTAEEAEDALRGEHAEAEEEDLVPTSRIVLKQGAAAQVLGSPSDIIALLFKDAESDATLDATGYPESLGYGQTLNAQ